MVELGIIEMLKGSAKVLLKHRRGTSCHIAHRLQIHSLAYTNIITRSVMSTMNTVDITLRVMMFDVC